MTRLMSMLQSAGKLAAKNSPAILTAVGVTGALTTAFLTGKASFKAAEILNKRENDRWPDDKDLEPKEKLDLVWKLFVPAAGTAIITVVCIIAANHLGTRRAAGLAAAYATSQQMFDEYQKKVAEKMGPKKEQTVRDEVAQERVNKIPAGTREVILVDPDDVYCVDAYTKRIFKSSHQRLKEAEIAMGYRLLHSDYASLNEFHSFLDLEPSEMGEELGWNNDHEFILDISTVLYNEKPCFYVSFKTKPKVRYDKFR